MTSALIFCMTFTEKLCFFKLFSKEKASHLATAGASIAAGCKFKIFQISSTGTGGDGDGSWRSISVQHCISLQ
jgi:hypothetical protein